MKTELESKISTGKSHYGIQWVIQLGMLTKGFGCRLSKFLTANEVFFDLNSIWNV